MVEYPWPGNIRELKHETARLVYMCPANQPVTVGMLGSRIRTGQTPSGEVGGTAEAESRTAREPMDIPTLKLEELEQIAVRCALERSHWNITDAAKLLGVSRHSVARRMKKHSLEARPLRAEPPPRSPGR